VRDVAIDRTASEGFAAGAASYERARPTYPAAAVDWLLRDLPSGARLLDLGAGTGKLTGSLVATGADVVAIEPVAGMRDRLAAAFPSVRLAAGTAEAIPIADGSVDAVLVAQAFHWFDGPRALAEIHRILRPEGRLGLLWNARDRSTPWVAEMSKIVDSYGDAILRHESGQWRDGFASPNGFTPLEEAEFPNVQEVTVEDVLERVASTSFVATLPDPERSAVMERVRTVLEAYPETRGRERFDFPHRTRAYFCRRS